LNATAGDLRTHPMSGGEIPTTDSIIAAMLALLDELTKRLEPDMATAVLREHGFKVSRVDDLQRRLNGLRA